jgi:peptide deformylase
MGTDCQSLGSSHPSGKSQRESVVHIHEICDRGLPDWKAQQGSCSLAPMTMSSFSFCNNETRMRIKITSVGEPVLRGEARPLTSEEIDSQRIRELIEHMRETLADAPGVGLAAPQIGEPLQLAIIEDKAEYHANFTAEELAERERRPVPFHVLINPQIQLLSPPEVNFFEGCLSLPGFVGIVPRARKVLVEALDYQGKPVRIEATGWYARILQLEIDHLQGTLYIDRMWTRSFGSVENYNRHWKSKSAAELKQLFQHE